MNADRKLISQPSVDSENNERVSTDRVGSFPFHAYNQYPTIYVCTHNGPTLHAHCVTIVLIPSLHRYLFFHSYLFISFFISITFLFLFIPLFIFFNFWHRLFQANMESSVFPVRALYRLFRERCEHRENGTEFFLFLFFLMKNNSALRSAVLEKLILRD